MSTTQLNMWDRPAAPPVESPVGDRHGLRPYQREAVDAVVRELVTHRSTLVVAHTGAGKTQIGGALAHEWPGRVLWLAHRDFLVSQARPRLRQMTGEFPATERRPSAPTGHASSSGRCRRFAATV